MKLPKRVVLVKDPETGRYDIPEGAVYVGRSVYLREGVRVLDPHPLRNQHRGTHPCLVKGCKRVIHSPEESRAAYRRDLAARPHLILLAVELADQGYDFACRCPEHLECHVDVLIDVVAIYRWLNRDGSRPSRTALRRAIDPDGHREDVTAKRARRAREALKAARKGEAATVAA